MDAQTFFPPSKAFGWDVLLCLGISETREEAAIKLGLMYTYRQQAEGLQSPA